MQLLRNIRSWLEEPTVNSINLDTDDRVNVHADVFRRKPILQNIYKEYYELMADDDLKPMTGERIRVELGSGVGESKDFIPGIVTTDVVPSKHIDRVIDAQKMDLNSCSVSAFYGINFFHHLPDPSLFFQELSRVLEPGGSCILVEPYHGPFASFLFKRLFDHEHFDKKQVSWETEGIDSPISGANQALAFIVFSRDRERFQGLFPHLEISRVYRIHNTLRRLLSGGMNFKQLVPSSMEGFLRLIEKILSPLGHFWCIDQVIVLRKRQVLQNQSSRLET